MDTNVMTAYKAMSVEDKAALKALQAEEAARTGREVGLSDIIAAVTPGMKNPAYLN
jgi:hypothetical protein